MARLIHLTWLALAAFMLPGCAFAEDKAPDYRYRLTVEVETPEGVKSGSSIIEVQQTLVRSGSSPANQAVERRVRGEAVAVDLPGGKTLFALLRSDNDIDWASRVFVLLAPLRKQAFEDSLDDVLEVKGEQALPRMWPAVSTIPERSAYPMLVTFGDLAKPASVAEVDPDDLAATFGEGVKLKRIAVELADDPVTTGIEAKLPWVTKHIGTLVYRPRDLPIGDMPIEHRLNSSDFMRNGR